MTDDRERARRTGPALPGGAGHADDGPRGDHTHRRGSAGAGADAEARAAAGADTGTDADAEARAAAGAGADTGATGSTGAGADTGATGSTGAGTGTDADAEARAAAGAGSTGAGTGAGTDTAAGNGAAPGAGPGGDAREYRAAELAELAGITTRTLRFYRERKLLPPPRREGRIAWYDEHHLARLRTISGLLARGHTLGGIADLLGAFESGRDSHGTAELLGLESSMITALFAEETPIRLTPEELADYYQGEVTVENLAASLDIGYIAVDGDEFVHTSRRLLDASSELVKKGIPLASVLAAGRELRRQSEAVADVFADLFRTHLLPKEQARAPEGLDAECLNDLLTQLRPLAKQVVEAELGLALDRRVRAEVEEWIAQGNPAPSGDAASPPDEGSTTD